MNILMNRLSMINATTRILMWTLLIKNGFGFISIDVEPLVVKIDNSDIDIRCIVDGTTLTRILSIQLIRPNTTGSNTTVVTVTRNRVALEDAALENKPGVTVNASVSNVMSPYLHLKISKTVVRYPEDMGSYQCSLLAVDSLGGLVRDHSLIVNITGFSASTFQSTSEKYFSQTNQKNTKEILPCTCSNGDTFSLVNRNRRQLCRYPPPWRNSCWQRNFTVCGMSVQAALVPSAPLQENDLLCGVHAVRESVGVN